MVAQLCDLLQSIELYTENRWIWLNVKYTLRYFKMEKKKSVQDPARYYLTITIVSQINTLDRDRGINSLQRWDL